MKFTDLNRLGGIGANSSVLQVGSFRFLVDAGIHPKEVGNASLPMLDKLNGEPLDFVLLTHCHLDHLGALPLVVKRNPGVPVYMSIPSRMLASRMLRNSVNVMKRQGREHNVKEYPFYTFAEVERAEGQYHALRYDHPKVIRNGSDKLVLTFYPSGHIAGAASVLIEHESESVFLTGDILFEEQETLPGAWIPDMKVDVVVTETTRGSTARAKGRGREEEWQRLFAGIRETWQRGGSVLLPVFALGRLQEMMAMLHKARKRGEIPKTPIFSAGLGLDLVDYFDQISRDTGLVRFRRKLLHEMKVSEPKYPRNPGEATLPQGIYVLSSGMMVEYTPSYQVAASMLGSEKNSVYFVGYCDPDTPGGILRASQPGDVIAFKVYEMAVNRRAQVEVFDLSGHADRNELLDLTHRLEPEAVVLSHGDQDARNWFKDRLQEAGMVRNVVDPVPGQTCEV